MGQRKSKQSKSCYEVTQKVSDQELRYERTKSVIPAPAEQSATAVSPDLIVPAAAPTNEAKTTTFDIPDGVDLNVVPKWVNEEQFIDILKENVEGFKKITKFAVYPAMAAGENYATLMLRVHIEIELDDKSQSHASYMLKVAHDSEQMRQMLEAMNFFIPENGMYSDVLPELEQMYQAVGVDVRFGPKQYKFSKDPGVHYLLLEDLRPHGFKNTNRLECLDMEHAECILRKLAQLHAASAVRVATVGPFSEVFMKGIFGEQAKAIMEQMVSAFNNSFLNNLKNYKDCEKYYDALERTLNSFIDDLVLLSEVDEKEFNVLCHGDCWSNNVLFKYNDAGNVENTYFVDFQMSKFGPPAQDLYYFIITSININYKLKEFDHFIRFYYDNLIENLTVLKYPKKLPLLRDLHTSLFKYGAFAIMPSYVTLPVVLLDPKEAQQSATFDSFIGDTDAATHFKNILFRGKRYTEYIEQILPWMYKRGLLEPRDVSDEVEKNDQVVTPSTVVEPVALQAESKTSDIIPDWVTEDSFVGVLRENVQGFKSIKKFSVVPATASGDNYLSLMLKVDIDVELERGAKFLSFMLKASPNDLQSKSMGDMMQTFEKESLMYNEVIQQLEKVYENTGEDVTFAPRSFHYPKVPECDTILMENARISGFKNADRLAGLDMDHTKAVLKKLAQFHAASAVYYENKGPYPELLSMSLFSEETRAVMEMMGAQFFDLFHECVKSFSTGEEYYEKLQKCRERHVDNMVFLNTVNPDGFNVLNHGDVWTNNILFQYDQDGNIKETQFVDFQIVKYGSPAQDLYYFLMSSPCLELKVEQFDYFIRYYYDNLKHYLELLKYSKKIPTLKELHAELIKYGAWGFATVSGVMSGVLLEPTNDANLNNMISDTEEGHKLKKLMFTNARYSLHAKTILTWLNRRGLLDNDDFSDYDAGKSAEVVGTSTVLEPAELQAENKTGIIIPDWLTEDSFVDVLRKNVQGFKSIQKFSVVPATAGGDNYLSLMLKVDIDIELETDGKKSMSFMLKASPNGLEAKNMGDMMQTFTKEILMYNDIIPQLEAIYKNTGEDVTFAPRSYQYPKVPGCDTILMENARISGFKNADRLAGLDMDHTKAVLKKLAQFHAASAVNYESKGPYPKLLSLGSFSEETREYMEQMISTFTDVFIECVKLFSEGEEYCDKLRKCSELNVDSMISLSKVNPNSFNVLNHGDVWTNNILFQYDNDGNIKETQFVDFQIVKYGSPAQDLYYFLMSSPCLELKVEQFDYFIRYYYDNLKHYLELLKYNKPILTLKDLHIELIKNGAWAFSTVCGVMTVVLLEPSDDANFDNMMSDSEKSNNFKKLMYTSARYSSHAKTILRWLNGRGLLDYDLEGQLPSIPEEKISSNIPTWINEDYFVDILQESITDFEKLLKLTSAPATKAGDNYASIILRVKADVELKNGSVVQQSFMLKIPPANPEAQDMLSLWNFFSKENIMYLEYLAEFEQMYKNAGTILRFAPKGYKFKKQPDCDTVLMEDLGAHGFKNANRLEGLNMDHTKCVLEKLAKLHAASVKRVELKGPYPEVFHEGIFSEKSRAMFEIMSKSSNEMFLECAREYEDNEEYVDKLPRLVETLIDKSIAIGEIDPKEFNVLNHGDTWLNNIMFQYDSEGKIKETFFVDFQLAKYGSPVYDLYYFLISSTQLDIKVEQFDYFIQYYYDHLVKNLSLLNCTTTAPTLKELHCALLKHGFLGFSTIMGVASICLLDPTEHANSDSFSAETTDAHKFRKQLYSNERYKAHAKTVLTWLNRRGLLDQ